MQILLNIQSNALKFTEKGHVTIKVGVCQKPFADFLEVEVVDSGIGIKQ